MAGGHPNVYLYCANDPISGVDPLGTDILDKLKNAYWNFGLTVGGWIDETLFGGVTESFGNTVGEYDCGNASGWDVARSGGWLGLNFLPAARPIKAVSSGVKALKGGAGPVRMGQAGERAAGITSPKPRIGPGYKTKSGYRIPDKVDKRAKELTEVKNVSRLSYNIQLQDYMAFCKKEGLQLILVVRRNTQLSKPLLDLEKKGQITIQRTLP